MVKNATDPLHHHRNLAASSHPAGRSIVWVVAFW
jgi:hypothetical protein